MAVHWYNNLIPALLAGVLLAGAGCGVSSGSIPGNSQDSSRNVQGAGNDSAPDGNASQGSVSADGTADAAVSGTAPAVTAADEAVPTDSNGDPIDTSRSGSRDHTPRVLEPSAPGKAAYGSGDVTIDASNSPDGYVEVRYTGDSPKVKIQLTPPDGNTYTYDVAKPGSYEVFPLTSGSGAYRIGVYTNVQDNMYATEYETTLDVALKDEFTAFLYPNQLVWFTKNSSAVAAAEEAVTPANNDLDAVSLIYDYVIHHMTYDWDKAKTVKSGYIPDVDGVLASGKGICFDYSSLLTAMLRSQRIPTRMEIGYAGTAYHAWVSTYLDEKGWVNGIIRFDGTSWELMDPTLATTETEQKYRDFIQAGDNYRAIYLY